jgi:hypothetical protein
MYSRISEILASVATILLLSSPIQPGLAALVTIQENVDLTASPFQAGPPQGLQYYGYDAAPVTIANGDSVSVTYNFTGGFRLRMDDLPSGGDSFETADAWLFLFEGTPGWFEISNIKVSFLDAVATGGAPTEVLLSLHSQGDWHLGPELWYFMPAGSSLAFSGIKATYDVVSVPGGVNLYKPWLNIWAEQLTIMPVPEPSTIVGGSLLLLPFGVAAFRRFRG